jgi:hypothetical protein
LLAEAWSAILALAPDEATLGKWFDRMAEVAPAIRDDVWEVSLWLASEPNRSKLMDRLEIDVLIVKLVNYLGKTQAIDRDDELVRNAVKVLELFFREKPPRLLGTYSRLISGLESLGANIDSLRTVVAMRRQAALKHLQEIRQRYPREEHRPTDWIGR